MDLSSCDAQARPHYATDDLIRARNRDAAGKVPGKTVLSREGDPMKFVSLEDTTGLYETVFFPKVYDRYCHMLNTSRPYILKGKVEEDFTALTLTVHWIAFLDRYNQKAAPPRLSNRKTSPAG